MAVTSLATSPLFGSLGNLALANLASELTAVRLKAGETLFNAGDDGDALYVVAFGRLRAVLRDGAEGGQVLGEIGRGESVGEMALLTGAPRSATVVAIRDTELVKLSKESFERMVERQPQVMLAITRLIISRYQRVIGPAERAQPESLAIVPCNPGIPIAEITAALARALPSANRVLTVDSELVKRERGIDVNNPSTGQEGSDLAGWLHELEVQPGFLLYVADPQPSAWTRICVRQADVVLLVGAAGAAANVTPGLLELLGKRDPMTGARREFVLTYDGAHEQPHGTPEWLARIPVTAHHHVDPKQPRDYERLARMLTGRALGLVLGGGGARGLAHIGIIKALEEARIPIDLVGGTSIGAFIGAQCAIGWDSARIREETRRVLVDGGSLNDFTIPILALLYGRRFATMFGDFFGERRIEDLPLSYYAIATNLTRSCCTAHRSGFVWRAVASSMSVPGLGPPIFEGQDVLVDGGVVNNLPVDIMRGFDRGAIFASSVSPRVEMRLEKLYAQPLSPWRVLFSWINPWGTPMQVPSIMSVLTRTASLQLINSGAKGFADADLVFEPPHAGFKLLDWKLIDKIAESGYRCALPAIEKWQAEQRAPAQPA